MFQSQVPLVDFYQNLLHAAKRAGYKMVLVALAREADSPAFYDDIKRYWSSLHDATGLDILFVFAGANASKELKDNGIRHRREPIAFVSDHIAFTGYDEKKWRMYWDGNSRPSSPLRYPEMDRYRSSAHLSQPCMERTVPDTMKRIADALFRLRKGKPYLDSNENITRDHTLEMYDLRCFLGIHENQIPCLAFTLLNSYEVGPFPIVTIPFSVFERTTIYLFIKSVSEKLEYKFREIDQINDTIDKCKNEITHLEKPLRNLRSLRISIRRENYKFGSPEVENAILQILTLSGSSNRSIKERTQCFSYYQTVRKNCGSNDFPELQRLIDWSFQAKSLPFSFDVNDSYNGENHFQNEISRLRKDGTIAWSEIKMKLRDFSVPQGDHETTQQWDYFIAYSSSDRSIAEMAFSKLSQIGRTFLDSRCLRPGDRWTERIRTAQNNSRSTLIIITEKTPNSWFVESEYLHAIKLMREGSHIIIPVLYEQDAKLPYGLDQLHAVIIKEWQDIEKLPSLVRYVVDENPLGAK